MPELVFDFLRRRHGVGDLLAHHIPEALAKTMHGHLDGALGRVQVQSGFGVAQLRLLTGQIRLSASN